MLHLSKFLSRSHTISNRWVIRLLQTLFPLLAIFLNNSSWITAKFLPFISDFQEKRAWKYIALQCTTIPWSVDLSLCSSFLNERGRVENSTLELRQKMGEISNVQNDDLVVVYINKSRIFCVWKLLGAILLCVKWAGLLSPH